MRSTPAASAWVLIGAAAMTAIASLIVAVISQRASRRNQDVSGRQAKELAELQGTLHEQQGRQDARTEYEFKARIRLYEEYEPLLFQLAEACESAFHRLINLARAARAGQIREDGFGWLEPTVAHERYDTDNYYLNSSIYMLLRPLAVFGIIRRTLTFVDLTVDPQIARTYDYAKRLYFLLSDDFELARESDGDVPRLEYDPFARPQDSLRDQDPAVYRRQGVAIGRIDNAVESLVVEVDQGKPRLMSLGQFTLHMSDPDSRVRQNMDAFIELLTGFHPASRPVLWRILIAKAHIYHSFMIWNKSMVANGENALSSWSSISPEVISHFDWRRPGSGVSDDAISAPFKAAKSYLERYLT